MWETENINYNDYWYEMAFFYESTVLFHLINVKKEPEEFKNLYNLFFTGKFKWRSIN